MPEDKNRIAEKFRKAVDLAPAEPERWLSTDESRSRALQWSRGLVAGVRSRGTRGRQAGRRRNSSSATETQEVPSSWDEKVWRFSSVSISSMSQRRP